MNKEDEKKFKEIFNKSADKLLDTLNNNPDDLFDIKKLSNQLADKSREIYKLTRENTNLKQALNEIRKYIKLMGKFDGERCTRNFKMMSADFNHILQIIDKVIGDDENG